MNDAEKTKEQLLNELAVMRQRIAALEESEGWRNRPKAPSPEPECPRTVDMHKKLS